MSHEFYNQLTNNFDIDFDEFVIDIFDKSSNNEEILMLVP